MLEAINKKDTAPLTWSATNAVKPSLWLPYLLTMASSLQVWGVNGTGDRFAKTSGIEAAGG